MSTSTTASGQVQVNPQTTAAFVSSFDSAMVHNRVESTRRRKVRTQMREIAMNVHKQMTCVEQWREICSKGNDETLPYWVLRTEGEKASWEDLEHLYYMICYIISKLYQDLVDSMAMGFIDYGTVLYKLGKQDGDGFTVRMMFNFLVFQFAAILEPKIIAELHALVEKEDDERIRELWLQRWQPHHKTGTGLINVQDIPLEDLLWAVREHSIEWTEENLYLVMNIKAITIHRSEPIVDVGEVPLLDDRDYDEVLSTDGEGHPRSTMFDAETAVHRDEFMHVWLLDQQSYVPEFLMRPNLPVNMQENYPSKPTRLFIPHPSGASVRNAIQYLHSSFSLFSNPNVAMDRPLSPEPMLQTGGELQLVHRFKVEV